MIKKVIYILISIMIFMMASVVRAETVMLSGAEYLYNIMYDKFDGINHNRKYVRVIRVNGDGDIAYCLEPFTNLIDGRTYTVYDNLQDFFEISDSDYERIKLYAYYGYGYKKHTDLKWVNITQMLIWRTIDKQSTFNWVDSVSSNANVVYTYQSEVNELNNLVTLYLIKPFIDQEIDMDMNSTIELEDFNNIFWTYDIYDDGGLDVSIDSNKLRITSSNESGSRIIRLKKKIEPIGAAPQYYYSSGSQVAFKRGDLEPSYFDITVNVKSGSIKVVKYDNDSDNNSDNKYLSSKASLVGSVFAVYDSNMNEVGEMVIDDNLEGVLGNLPFGKYTVKEKKAGIGYNVNPDSIVVNLNSENDNVTVKFGNDIIKSSLRILKRYGTKTDYEQMTMKSEEGVSFEIYDVDGNLVDIVTTSSSGEATIVLPFGEYEVIQVNSTENYAFVPNQKIVIDENSSEYIDLVLDDIEIEVPNARCDYSNFRELCFGVLDEFFAY